MNRTILTSFTILCLLSTVFSICLNIQTIKANGTSIQVSPNTTVNQGGNFILNITVNNVKDMCAWWVDIKFRRIINIRGEIDSARAGYNCYELDTFSTEESFSGSKVLEELNFTAVYNGTTQIDILDSGIVD